MADRNYSFVLRNLPQEPFKRTAEEIGRRLQASSDGRYTRDGVKTYIFICDIFRVYNNHVHIEGIENCTEDRNPRSKDLYFHVNAEGAKPRLSYRAKRCMRGFNFQPL